MAYELKVSRIVGVGGALHNLEIGGIGSIAEGVAVLKQAIDEARVAGIVDPEEATAVAVAATATPAEGGAKRGRKSNKEKEAEAAAAEAAKAQAAGVVAAPAAMAPAPAPAPSAFATPAPVAAPFASPAAPAPQVASSFAPPAAGFGGFAPAAPAIPPMPPEGYLAALTAIFAGGAQKDAAEGGNRRQTALGAIYAKHAPAGVAPNAIPEPALAAMYNEIVTGGFDK